MAIVDTSVDAASPAGCDPTCSGAAKCDGNVDVAGVAATKRSHVEAGRCTVPPAANAEAHDLKRGAGT